MTGTIAHGINDHGGIVGQYAGPAIGVHGFVLSRGAFTSLDFPAPGVIRTHGRAINNRGDIVRWYVDSDGFNHGFALGR